jgi:hypothetical protein
MRITRHLPCVLLIASGATQAASPWLPAPNALNIRFSYLFQTADEFYLGNKKTDLPDDLEQHTFLGYLEYGLTDSLALDARLGYAFSEFPRDPALNPQGRQEGMTDTNVGLRWRVLDEAIDEWATVTLRAGLIVEGDYRTGAINSIGDGASGGEFSALIGRSFDNGISLYGEAGYRTRGSNVPDDVFLNLGGRYAFTPEFSAGVNYQMVEALSGIDIGAPGFTPARFPETNEDYQILGFDVAYRFLPSAYASVSYSGTVDGRNTGAHQIVGFNLGYGF